MGKCSVNPESAPFVGQLRATWDNHAACASVASVLMWLAPTELGSEDLSLGLMVSEVRERGSLSFVDLHE